MAEFCASLGVVGKFIARRRAWVLLVGIILVLVSAVGASQFMSITTLTFAAPKGYPSYDAEQAMKKAFPALADSSDYAGVLVAKSPRKVLDLPGIVNFSYALNASLSDIRPLVSFVSNVTLFQSGIQSPPGLLVSEDGSATLFQWVVNLSPPSDAGRHFADQCDDVWKREVERWLPADAVEQSGVTSLSTITNAGIKDSEASLAAMDAIALPLAVLVLWYVLQSGRLLLFPLLTVASSASLSFGVMYLVGLVSAVQTSTPSLMMSILIAMSIDYSLFFLTRFRKELMDLNNEGTEGSSNDAEDKVIKAICTTMQTAGFTIILSGATLTTSFIAIAFFPVDVISSLGVGCTLSLLIVIVVHLTLGPALLAYFPAFFSRSVGEDGAGRSCSWRCTLCKRRRLQNQAAAPLVDNPEARSSPIVLEEARGGDEDGEAPDSGCSVKAFWRKMAKLTTTPLISVIIIVVVTAATFAVGYPVLDMKLGDSNLAATPRGTPVYETYETLMNKFGAGSVNPYRVLMTLKPEQQYSSVLEQKPWEDSQLVVEEMVKKLPLMEGVKIQSISYSLGPSGDAHPVSYEFEQACEKEKPPAGACIGLLYAIAGQVSKDKRSSYASVVLNWDPLNSDGSMYLHKARDLLADLHKRTCFDLHLSGAAPSAMDMISEVYGLFPYMIALTLAAALLLLGLAFRSIVMPLRSVLSICLTLVLVYGLATRVFQYGEFDWLGVPGISGRFKSEMWLLPVVCFSIVVGICLDYDIFLLSRVTEFREAKMSARESIEEGLSETGGIISAAGLVMAIAFGGLLFSSVLVVNGLSFFLVIAVLYDTLIMRCLFTPAVMGLLDRINWWPSGLARKDVCSSESGSDSQTPTDAAPGPLEIPPASADRVTETAA